MSGSAALWLTVIALGAYHGLNPAMGWPLAVANGMTVQRGSAVLATLLPLGSGHFFAMAVVLAPFAWLNGTLEWGRGLRIGAGALVVLFGMFRLVQRRHPRALARIRPTRLAWWSFLMATAHGAGLMLVPITLSLCTLPAASLGGTFAGSGAAATALQVAVVHTLAMIGSGLAIAWIVYRHLGLRVLRQTWFNLDAVWALSLVVTGAIGFAMALAAGR